jgi:DNA replication protein DnaC
LSYERYLFGLASEEMASREAHRIERAISQARFPVLKDLADFDWNAVPSVPKARILELAQGAYIPKAEPIILLGNPGLGKSHVESLVGPGRVPTRAPGALLQCGWVGQ